MSTTKASVRRARHPHSQDGVDGARPGGQLSSIRSVYGALLGVAALMVALDQWAKKAALDGLDPTAPKKILGGLIFLDLTSNPGAAFSMGEGYTFVFPVIAILISIGIVWFARTVRSWPWAVALGLIMGGALGNLVDRLFRAPGPFRGEVVDFISVFGPNAQYFPIFNVADSALSVGVVLAIALELFGFRRDGLRVSPRRSA